MRTRLWNHNIQYHSVILRSLPSSCRRALDVGCGQGFLARQLAQHCAEVMAIDADHNAISQAAAAGDSGGRIRFIEGDVMTYPFPQDGFDLITAVASLHHLELRPALAHFRSLLNPGGILAIVGLYRGETISDLLVTAAAFPTSWLLRCIRGYAEVAAPVQNPRETLREIRGACDELLPGAQVRRHLLFRYSLIWRKPF